MNFSSFTTTPKKQTTGTPLEFWTNLMNAMLEAGSPQPAAMFFVNDFVTGRIYDVVLAGKLTHEHVSFEEASKLVKQYRTGIK